MKTVSDNEKQDFNLYAITFNKEDTYGYKRDLREEEIESKRKARELERQKVKKKIKNLKILGKMVALSALCVASGKTYKLIDSKILEIKEDKAMDDYYKPLAKVIVRNKEYITDEYGELNEDRYTYHYDKIGEYIDKESNKVESIYSQNKYVAAKDFYIASATKYFENHYGDMDEVIENMKSTGDNATLKDYVKTLGYTSVDDYVDSIYQINYSFKQNNINTAPVKTLK